MKQILAAACILLFAASCNNSTENKDEKPAAAASTPAAAEKLDYPYTLPEPYKNWQIGDPKNVVTLLKSLKAFENGDVAASMAGFGDTVEINFNNY